MWPYVGTIPTYGILYFAAMIAHAVWAWRLARWERLPARVWIAVALSYLLTMSVGARLLYDAMHGEPVSVTAVFTKVFYTRGGLWGGPMLHLALATGLILVLTRRRAAALDVMALALLLPLAISKLACFCQGCCFGRPSGLPWAVRFPPGGNGPVGMPLHPTQLYDVAALVIVYSGLLWLRRETRWTGLLLPWFLILQGAGRVITEFWRGDYDRRLLQGLLSESQIVCLASALAGAAVVWYVDAPRRREALVLAAAQTGSIETRYETQSEEKAAGSHGPADSSP